MEAAHGQHPVDDHPETALHVLLRRAADDPGGEVVRFLDGVAAGARLTATGVTDLAGRAAAGLAAAGVGSGDHVVTCLPGSPALLGTWFGTAALGAVEVPLATDSGVLGVADLLELVAPRVVVTSGDVLATDTPVAAAIRRWEHAGGHLLVLDHAGWSVVPPDPGALRPDALDPLAPAVAMTTSGTTGRSKAALLPHFAGVRQARRVAATMGYTPDDVLFNVFPWHHINVRHSAFLAALHAGARLVVSERFHASRFWATCREQGVTAFNFMGAMAAMLQRAPVGPDDRSHRVTRGYGAPAPAPVAGAFERRFGVRLLESFASTELADVAANTVQVVHPGTAGRVLPEYEVAVRDAEGRDLVDATGVLYARPRRPGVAFLGYLGDPRRTAETIDGDGWIRTGDLVRLTRDGCLVHAGRRTDVIRRRGENVSAPEVADVVAALPGVIDVAVVGVDSPLSEQEIAVTVATGTHLTASDVHAWCVGRLARHAVPRYVRVVPELPLNRSMKVDLARLATPEWIAVGSVFEPPRRPEPTPPATAPDERRPST